MSMSKLVMHCWFVDWLIYRFLLYDYLIFSLYPRSFHARLPTLLEYKNGCPTVYSCLNIGYDQFSMAHPAGLIIDTHNWQTVYRNNALSRCKKEEQRDKVKAKDVEGQIEKMTMSELGGEVIKVNEMILKEQWLEMRRWNEKVGRKLAWRQQY